MKRQFCATFAMAVAFSGLANAQLSWTAGSSSVGYQQAVAYGGGVYVAVGPAPYFETSTDGLNWVQTAANPSVWWTGVTYGNGTFVAVGANGFATSSDGTNWSFTTPPNGNSWNSVAYGNGVFVTVAGNGTNRVMTSADGVTWTNQTAAAANSWNSVVYGNGLFVAVAQSGSGNRVMTSPDGITWTSRSSAANVSWAWVTYGNGLFVAVAYDGVANSVMTSPDGITWTLRTAASSAQWISVTYGNGLFVAVAQDGISNSVMTSSDGITWTIGVAASSAAWQCITFGNGIFVAGSTSADTMATASASPAITSFTPTSGTTAGGTSVTITGTSFTGATAVTFGATAASSFTVDSDTQITAVSPTGTGAVSINVTTPGGTGTSSGTFTYSSPVTTYTFTGPSTGALNSASTNFTVTPNGPYTGTITITPSGGGLSTPIVLTFSNSSAAQTFTITPTAAGPVTLTPTNNGSLTNPSLLTYGTAAAAQFITFSQPAQQMVGTALMPGATASSGLPVSYSSSTTAVCTVNGSTVSFLSAGTCTITASQDGNGTTWAWANPVQKSFLVVGSPGAPAISFVTAGNGQISVGFIPPASNGGSAITSYAATCGSRTVSGMASPIIVTGLNNGTAYRCTVTAINRIGSGPASAPANAVTPGAAPGAPTTATATAGNGQATVTFTPPANNGGSPISLYTVVSNPGGLTASGSGSPIILTGLSNGTAYTFTVTAQNAAGTGPASAPSNAVTPQSGVPGAPQSVSATAGDREATVSFTPPANSGSSGITNYVVAAIPGGQTASGSASPITVKGLRNGATYTFTVAAANAAGTGAASAASNAVTPAAPLTTNLQSFPVGVAGQEYPLQILTATGGVAPYVFSITAGKLPDGITFSSPQFGGVPTASGNFSFTISVTDASGKSASTPASITINNSAQANLIISQSVVPFSLSTGANGLPAPANVTVRSTMIQQLLNYSVTTSPAVPWLQVSGGGTTPGSIGVALTPAAMSLAAASTPYQTTINVTCMAPSPCVGSVQTINVALTVSAPPPQLSALTPFVSFRAPGSGLTASSGTIDIENTGGGTLEVLSVTAGAPWLTVSNVPTSLNAGADVPVTVSVDPTGLSAGYNLSEVTFSSSAGSVSVPVSLVVSGNPTMTLAPSGIALAATAGSAPGSASGSFNVAVSRDATVNWSAAVLPGSPWLSVNGSSGTASSSKPGMVSFAIDPELAAQLAPNTYYGTIRVTSGDVTDSPVDFGVVLDVGAATSPVKPDLSPAGLVFFSSVGRNSPASQSVKIRASSNAAVSYQASAATNDQGAWLTVSPSTGTASSGTPGSSIVSVNTAGLAPGIYTGGVSYAFESAAVRTVNVTLIVASAAQSSSTSLTSNAQSGCVATRLVPTEIGLVDNFEQQAGWPVAISAIVLDDCGAPATNTQVTASFSNGDAPITLMPVDNSSGVYSGTWTPQAVSPQTTVTIRAATGSLQAANTQITGQVSAGAAPLLSPNGTISAFYTQAAGMLAPGTIISIYGSNLAAATAQVGQTPLPTSLGGTSVVIGGMAAPLFFVSPGQINAQIPFTVSAGNQYQVQVNNGGALSTPESIQLTAAAPGIASLPSGLVIAQRYPDNSLVTEDAPARPGNVLTVYLVGLGATDQPVDAGAASPGSAPAQPVVKPVMMLNGEAVPIEFAGLTPGTVGLYQINFQVPANAAAGDLTLVVSQAGANSNSVVLPVQP